MARNLCLATFVLMALSGCANPYRTSERLVDPNEACRLGDIDACRMVWSDPAVARPVTRSSPQITAKVMPLQSSPPANRQVDPNEACRLGNLDACMKAWSEPSVARLDPPSPPSQMAAPPSFTPIPTPRFASTGGAYRSRIDGEFKGWEGTTIYKLLDGRVIQQNQYHYHYHYAYSPEILIYSDGFGTLKAHIIDDEDQDVGIIFLN